MTQLTHKKGLLSALLMSAFLISCGGQTDAPEQQVAKPATDQPAATQTIPGAPTYIVYTDPSNAPFEMRGEDGNIIGLDMDVLNAIAKQQKFNYEVRAHPWQGILETLEKDESDLITGVVVLTEERAQKYDFTDPILHKKRYAYLKQSTAEQHQINKFADICPLKVAVKAKTDKAALYDSVCGEENPNKIAIPSSYESFRMMLSAKADVAIGDDVLFDYYIRENKVEGVIRFANEGESEIPLAWPVKKGNSELLNKLNNGLRTLKSDGAYQQIKTKWLGE